MTRTPLSAAQPPKGLSAPDDLLAAQVYRLITSELISLSAWSGPICHDGQIFMSFDVMKEAYRLASRPLPLWVYATKQARQTPNADEILHFLFPSGIPPFESVPKETAIALERLIRDVQRLSECPGMEKIVEDAETVIVLDQDKFMKFLEEKVGQLAS